MTLSTKPRGCKLDLKELAKEIRGIANGFQPDAMDFSEAALESYTGKVQRLFIAASALETLASAEDTGDDDRINGVLGQAGLRELQDGLRAAVSYPFDPAKKMSEKARYEQVIKNVLKIAGSLTDTNVDASWGSEQIDALKPEEKKP